MIMKLVWESLDHTVTMLTSVPREWTHPSHLCIAAVMCVTTLITHKQDGFVGHGNASTSLAKVTIELLVCQAQVFHNSPHTVGLLSNQEQWHLQTICSLVYELVKLFFQFWKSTLPCKRNSSFHDSYSFASRTVLGQLRVLNHYVACWSGQCGYPSNHSLLMQKYLWEWSRLVYDATSKKTLYTH